MVYCKIVVSFVVVFVFLGMFVVFYVVIDIFWWYVMGGCLGEVVVDIVNGYNEMYDVCQIILVYKGIYEEIFIVGIVVFCVGEQLNIIQVFDVGVVIIIGVKGVVILVQDILQNVGVVFNVEDYIEGVCNFYVDSDGKMIGMLFNLFMLIFYYNVDVFEKVGVEVLKIWEEFQEIVLKLKEVGYVLFVQFYLFWIFIENFKFCYNLQFVFNNNGYDGVKGIQLVFGELIKNYFIVVKGWLDDGLFGYYGIGWGDNQILFNEGKVVMWFGFLGFFGGIFKIVEFLFFVIYLLYWDVVEGVGIGMFIGGVVLFLMVGKLDEENKCVVFFFEYLIFLEVQYMWYKEIGYVLIINVVYELVKEDGYYNEVLVVEIGIKQLILLGGDWIKGYWMGFYVQICDVMNCEYGKILLGEMLVEDVFVIIEVDGNKFFEWFFKIIGN